MFRERVDGGVRRRLAILPALLALTGCQPGVLDPQGFVGASEKMILIDSLAIMLAIVIPTIIATVAFAWWFRATNTKAKYLPDWSYSGSIELIVWGIPTLTIMLLGGVTWVASHDLDPAVPIVSNTKPIEIQGVSLDWKWLFIYPDQHVASVNQLVVPAGVPLHFSLTSGSVMNAFFVPQLGSMIYTMNGMTSTLNLISDNPGTFAGLSSHYSGDGFSDMHFEVHALPAAAFANWVTTTRAASGPALDAASYAALAKQSANVAPFTYHNADTSIFAKIVSQQIPPAAGPMAGLPSVGVSNRTEK
jgi:cytochrome o ubiquinol oxidase subunit 2